VQEEQWTQVDVSSVTQHTVGLIIEAAVADPAECAVPAPAREEGGSANGVTKVLNVEDKSFFVVKATADSLVLLGDYLKIVINLELVVTDVMSRIIEFLKVCPTNLAELIPVFQLQNLPGRARSRGHAVGWAQEHHGETSW